MKMDGLELHFFVLGKPKERLEKSSMKGEAFSPQREYHVKHMDGGEKEREVTQRR